MYHFSFEVLEYKDFKDINFDKVQNFLNESSIHQIYVIVSYEKEFIEKNGLIKYTKDCMQEMQDEHNLIIRYFAKDSSVISNIKSLLLMEKEVKKKTDQDASKKENTIEYVLRLTQKDNFKPMEYIFIFMTPILDDEIVAMASYVGIDKISFI